MLTPAYAPTATERVLPRLALDFTTGVLDPRVTVTRALNTATRVNSSGYIETVNADLPRFDYNPVTLAPKGLLIEETRTNLALRSQQFNEASWGKGNVNVSPDSDIGPDGTLSADKIIPTTASGLHRVTQDVTFNSTTSFSFSVFVKAAGYVTGAIVIGGLTSPFPEIIASFNLTNVTVTTSGGGTVTGSSITSVGNGWYRVSLSGYTGQNGLNRLYIYPNAYAVYTGDGTSGIIVYGAQLEAGAFPTSYIPTTTTSLTRNRDDVSMTGTNFSSWFNASEGAFVVSFDDFSVGATFTNIYRADDGTASNRLALYKNGSSTSVGFDVTTSGGSQANIVTATASIVNPTKHAATYKDNSFAASVNGGAVTTDTTGNVPSGINTLRIGRDTANGAGTILNGHIQELLYYPQRLIAAELQAFSK